MDDNKYNNIRDMIFRIYRIFDCPYNELQIDRLAHICMNDLNAHSGLDVILKDDRTMAYYVIQSALQHFH